MYCSRVSENLNVLEMLSEEMLSGGESSLAVANLSSGPLARCHHKTAGKHPAHLGTQPSPDVLWGLSGGSLSPITPGGAAAVQGAGPGVASCRSARVARWPSPLDVVDLPHS